MNRTGQTNVKVEHENQQAQDQQGQKQQGQQSQNQQGKGQNQSASNGMPLVAAKQLIGTQVKTTNGKNAGEIKNLLIGPKGKVQAAVVEWGGGIFGIGSNQNVVPIKDMQVTGNQAEVNLTKNQLKKLPSFNKSAMNQYGTGWHAYR